MREQDIGGNFMILEETLLKNRNIFGRVVPFNFNKESIYVFDFTNNNIDIKEINLNSAESFDSYVKRTLTLCKALIGIGRYSEDRIIYQHSSLFSTARTIHLGIDIILPAGTKVFSPLDGIIHSFQNNNAHGDYGQTIVIQHELDEVTFYILYGHLSEDSLGGKSEGQKVKKGEVIGEIGNIYVNGNWFEHVHFQIIGDMLGKKGDFPGVASIYEREQWLRLCPDPNLILNIDKLR